MFTCDLCFRIFTRKDNLKRHGDCRIVPKICERCGDIFKSEGAIKRHLEEKHPKPRAPKIKMATTGAVPMKKQARLNEENEPSTSSAPIKGKATIYRWHEENYPLESNDSTTESYKDISVQETEKDTIAKKIDTFIQETDILTPEENICFQENYIYNVKMPLENIGIKRTINNKNNLPNEILKDSSPKQLQTEMTMDDNDDTKYILSFRSYMKTMTKKQKLDFKIGMLELVKTIFEGQDQDLVEITESPPSQDDLQGYSSEDSNMASGKKWRESDTIKFVELYEKSECLWNFRHPGYKHRNARDKAIQNIIDEMNLPDFGPNELKNKIKNIRSTYQQEVNKIKRSKQGLGTDILEEYKTNLAWFPIADRFLGGVINSSKYPLPKTEYEDSFYYQSNQSLFNLVETEMTNGDMDNEAEESYASIPISIDRIKEEVEVKEEFNDYPITSVTPYPKKRRMSYPLGYDPTEVHKSDEPSDIHNPNSTEDLPKDEWYFFGNNVSCQLRHLPLERALGCQKKIFDILTQERLAYIKESKAEEKNKEAGT